MSIFNFKKRSATKTISSQPKEVDQILDEQIQSSLREFNRSNRGLFMSAFTAGLEIGFSVLLMGTIFTLFSGSISDQALKICLALCYPIGFIFVIIGRSELFTEHTALAILPVLKRSVGVKQLFTLWGLVYAGNLLGGMIFSFILSGLGPRIGFINEQAFHHLAYELVNHDWDIIFYSAILAGWMMGLLGWLLTSSRETISRIFLIMLVTSVIGMAGLHHCIVGSIEALTGVLSGAITIEDYIKFQSWATIGNTLGGTIFVAVLKYSNVRFD